jgi:hypothetical protein
VRRHMNNVAVCHPGLRDMFEHDRWEILVEPSTQDSGVTELYR